MFSPSHLLKSLKFAFSGLFYVLRNEQNFRLQFFVSAIVLAGALFFKFSTLELGLVIIVISFLLISEIFNTVIEKVLDLAHPDWGPAVKIIKDISASIVLIFSIGALAVVILLFWPYVIK